MPPIPITTIKSRLIPAVENLSVGEKVALSGRIQSREYQKKLSETEIKTMTAYEVSISKLAAYDSFDNFDLDKEFDIDRELNVIGESV